MSSVAALLLLLGLSSVLSAEDRSFQCTEFLNAHCVHCHDAAESNGEIRLDDLPDSAKGLAAAERWQAVLEAIESGYMPPEEEPELKAEHRQSMVSGLKQLLTEGLAAESSLVRTPMRRMNRFQYNNAVVDLLELRLDLFALPERMMRDHSKYFDPASGKMPANVKVGSRPLGKSQLVQKRLAGVAPFPQDLRAEHGFDNRADHLSLSPLLMESFLQLGRSIVNSADFGPSTCGAWTKLFMPPDRDVDVRDEVQRRLKGLLTRAFRRTVRDEDLDRYTIFVMNQIDSHDSFTEGMKLAVSAVLSSPRFLYLYQGNRSQGAAPSDDFELASRLSFFLWGSIPDQELLQLAASNDLSQKNVLSEQITRMLNDPKLKRFCDSFPAQWLQLEHIISAKPDAEKFASFYRGQYRASMHMMVEPLLLFETVLVENRSIMELIDPPFSYRSELLEGWLETGEGSNFRPNVLAFQRVKNRDRREGGVITNPAVMTMTSGPERSKPITRGAWIASVILNRPPKPPPADVPPLPEANEADTENLTLRERLDLHRERADCRGCHERIDPLGFAMENYGPTGVWREVYDNGRDVDSSGLLFGEHRFSNPVEFKDALLQESELFTRALAKHLLSFALGREVSVTDSIALDEIVEQTVENDYKMRELIRQVVLSEPFIQGSTRGKFAGRQSESSGAPSE